jgi:hypothetical protein
MKKNSFLTFIVILFLTTLSPVLAGKSDEGKSQEKGKSKIEISEDLAALKGYATQAQVMAALNGVGLTEEAFKYGAKGIGIMFSPDFPSPPHPVKVVNKGWACLLDRLQKAKGSPDSLEEALTKEQIAQFNLTFKLHKKSISVIDSEYAEHIPSIGCEMCLRGARGANGFPQEEDEEVGSY